MPDFEAWTIFAHVAEQQGFSSAARELGVTKATVSKAVARLERAHGVALFHRSSRRLALSAAGEALLPHARAIVAAGEAAQDAALGESAMLAGRIRMAAPYSYGNSHLGPMLADFMALHPDVELQIDLADKRVDLIGGGYDLAIRIGDLADSSLRAIRLRDVRLHTVAAASYCARYGQPVQPADLVRHRCLVYTNRPRPLDWRFWRSDGGDAVSVTVRAALSADSSDIFMPALLAGEGITQLPDFFCTDALASGQLLDLLPGWTSEVFGLYLLMPPSQARPARVATLMAFLRDRIGREETARRA